MPWVLFALGVFAVLTTAAGLRAPLRPSALRVPAFFFGWLASELPLHHLACQVVVTVVLIGAGGLDAWPGGFGLATMLGSWLGLIALWRRQPEADPAYDAALTRGLGDDYRERIDAELAEGLDAPLSTRGLSLPLAFADARVERVRDLAYGPHGVRNRLDVYRPADGRTGCPILVQVHGGGWTMGQKEHQALPLLYRLAAHGWVCVSLNYRLSPSATFPEHLIDVKRALAWLRERAADHGADASFIAITGGSAGGHLAALAALTPNDPEYQPGFESADTRVQCAIPVYAPYDLIDRDGLQPDDAMHKLVAEQFVKKPLHAAREEWAKGSPIDRIHPEAPPFFAIHGGADTFALPDGAHAFVDAFRRHAPDVELVYAEIPGAQHAFDTFMTRRGQLHARAIHRYLAHRLSEHRRKAA